MGRRITRALAFVTVSLKFVRVFFQVFLVGSIIRVFYEFRPFSVYKEELVLPEKHTLRLRLFSSLHLRLVHYVTFNSVKIFRIPTCRFEREVGFVSSGMVDNLHCPTLFHPKLSDNDVVNTALDVAPSVGLIEPESVQWTSPKQEIRPITWEIQPWQFLWAESRRFSPKISISGERNRERPSLCFRRGKPTQVGDGWLVRRWFWILHVPIRKSLPGVD